MRIYITTQILDDDEASDLENMAAFFRMPVEGFLCNAIEVGLAHAESVMLENERHHEEIEAAMQGHGPRIGKPVH